MIWRTVVTGFVTLFVCASANGVVAQSSGDLDAIESAIESGRLEGVRERLENWIAGANDVSTEQAGRVGFLRARLMTDVDSAHAEYLSVAIDGRSSYGALAWLRLAQLELARGAPARAVEDLERLHSDYPTSPHAPAAWYWTGRALESGGQLDEACTAFERAAASGDEMVVTAARERQRGCDPAGLRFTLQIGAFSGESAAASLASTARALGYPTRVIRDDDLDKVRVGRFSSAETARMLEGRLRADGFSVTIVAAES